VLKITEEKGQLQFESHKLRFPMTHFHYDRFDTPDDEIYGKLSVNFRTNPQGEVDEAVMSLDEAAVVFTRKAETPDAKLLAEMAGSYELPSGMQVTVTFYPTRGLSIAMPGSPPSATSSRQETEFPHAPVRGCGLRVHRRERAGDGPEAEGTRRRNGVAQEAGAAEVGGVRVRSDLVPGGLA
jgi:hypothetical protein